MDLKYVTQNPSGKDKRYIDIIFTDKDVEVLKHGNILFDDYNNKLLGLLSKSDVKAAENLINNLQKIIK